MNERTSTDASARAGENEYVVSEGDTLSEIARKELGNADQWRQIAQVNEIEDPTKLAVGKRLRLPDADEPSGEGATNDDDATDSDDDSLF